MRPPDRKSFSVVLALAAILFITSGCASVPTRLEQRLFTIQTNYTPVVTTETRSVTNDVVTWQTNEVAGVVTVSTWTNRTVEAVAAPVTNWAASYDYEKGTGANTVQGVAGAVGGVFGDGGIAGIITGGILGLWGLLRSKKANKVSAVLAQGIETSRSLLLTTPKGAELDANLKDWLIRHQKEKGVLDAVIPLLKQVDPSLADFVAEQLKKAA